jgi:MYXO-CTERM domain-containing protein
MDFIERIFGFSPDGGNGSFEYLLFAVPVIGLLLLWRRRQLRRERSRDRHRSP